MNALAGPLHAAALVLLFAGASKGARPAAAAIALRTVDLPGNRVTVRLLAGVEVAIAVAVLAGVGPLAAVALAAAHAGFAVVAFALRRRSADCGCFGEAAPVTGIHLAVNLAIVGVATAAALGGDLPSLGAAIGATPGAGAPYAVLVAVLAAAEVLCLTALAEVQAAGATA